MAYVGYARVSSSGQSLEVQLARLAACDRIFEEKKTGTHANRAELTKCLEWVRAGDTLVVTKLDRLARSLLDLCQIAERLRHKGVELEILDQRTDTSTPAGRLLFQMLGVIAEFETALRKERQMEGIAHAKQIGTHFGPHQKLSQGEQALLRARYDAGDAPSTLMQDYGIGKSTLYRYLAAQQPSQAAAD